eukprot:10651237-Alexandrium_andersonii.AAC.1
MHTGFTRSSLELRAGADAAWKSVPEAPVGCALRRFSHRMQSCQRRWGLRVSEVAKSRGNELQSA